MKTLKSKLAVLVLFAASLISIHTNAQTSNLEEVVYLKNGSVIRGTIFEQIPNKSIKIQTRDNNLFVFEISEVEKITKEAPYPPPSTPEVKKYNPQTSTEPRGNKISYELITEGGYLVGFGEITTDQDFLGFYEDPYLTLVNEDQGFSLKTVHAIKLNQHFMIGGGIGFDFLKSLILMPITVDTRILLGKNKVQPFFNIALGHAAALNGETGGFLFHAGFGIKSQSGWAFNIALRTQKTDWGFMNQGTMYKTNGTGKFFSITSGYFF